jgi:uncharacterized membrane protein YfcA
MREKWGQGKLMRYIWLLTAAVSGAVAVAGGLIGLGGAELRLPFLVGALGIAVRQAVPANLAVSLVTVAAALPPRLRASDPASLMEAAPVAVMLAAGAMAGAWFGAGYLRRLSTPALTKLVGGLLVVLGVAMLIEAVVPLTQVGLIPADDIVRTVAGLAIGVFIGAVASLLGVAGGEIIIPVLVVGFGFPIADAGTLSLLISLPTILVGLARYLRAGAYAEPGPARSAILPLAVGAVVGAPIGGALAPLAPAAFIKVLLGGLLIWSAWKTLGPSRAR